jgi:hypothetical protein
MGWKLDEETRKQGPDGDRYQVHHSLSRNIR